MLVIYGDALPGSIVIYGDDLERIAQSSDAISIFKVANIAIYGD